MVLDASSAPAPRVVSSLAIEPSFSTASTSSLRNVTISGDFLRAFVGRREIEAVSDELEMLCPSSGNTGTSSAGFGVDVCGSVEGTLFRFDGDIFINRGDAGDSFSKNKRLSNVVKC